MSWTSDSDSLGKRGPRPIYGERASVSIHIRLTPTQRADLELVARQNQYTDLAAFIRDAIDEAVADCRERGVFTRSA